MNKNKLLQSVEGGIESPTVAWVEEKAQIKVNKDSVKAGKYHLHLLVVKTWTEYHCIWRLYRACIINCLSNCLVSVGSTLSCSRQMILSFFLVVHKTSHYTSGTTGNILHLFPSVYIIWSYNFSMGFMYKNTHVQLINLSL